MEEEQDMRDMTEIDEDTSEDIFFIKCGDGADKEQQRRDHWLINYPCRKFVPEERKWKTIYWRSKLKKTI